MVAGLGRICPVSCPDPHQDEPKAPCVASSQHTCQQNSPGVMSTDRWQQLLLERLHSTPRKISSTVFRMFTYSGCPQTEMFTYIGCPQTEMFPHLGCPRTKRIQCADLLGGEDAVAVPPLVVRVHVFGQVLPPRPQRNQLCLLLRGQAVGTPREGEHVWLKPTYYNRPNVRL
jgi:hypothetical protein